METEYQVAIIYHHLVSAINFRLPCPIVNVGLTPGSKTLPGLEGDTG
jgi:hypothetical protein